MSLCEGRALAWASLESALPFKLCPPSSAAQVSCSLADLQEALLKALPVLSKGMRSRHPPLLGGEFLT